MRDPSVEIYFPQFHSGRECNLTCDALNDVKTRLSYNWMHPEQSTSSIVFLEHYLSQSDEFSRGFSYFKAFSLGK